MPALRVERTGLQLLVQDLGRPGWAHVGVPPSGALDPAALALANRLVGNPESAAGLEILLGGCGFTVAQSMRVALTGAHLPLAVDGAPKAWGSAVSVRAGQRVEVGIAPGQLRAWLAVSGGIDLALVLGSRSTDTLTGLGPAAVTPGDVLPVGPEPDAPGHGDAVPATHATGPLRLSVRLGPRDDAFTDGSLESFFKTEYTVSASSDRVALRLDAPEGALLARREATEVESEGVVTGAVQVPPEGSPLVFLADHPVTGGYPVIAVVDAPDLPRCAQLQPGDRVVFARLRAQ
jgi:biotin-dependent carboxylase-like uncharacterized protein